LKEILGPFFVPLVWRSASSNGGSWAFYSWLESGWGAFVDFEKFDELIKV